MLEISYGDRTSKVEVARQGSREVVLVDGDVVECDRMALEDGRCSLILYGRVYDLTASLQGETCVVELLGESLDLHVADPRRPLAPRPEGKGGDGPQRIVAEMPGKVIRVLVRPGDVVTFEQGLLVIEAMKMQNQIRAPRGGVVREIGVVEGKAVNSGDLLVSLD